MAQKLHQIKRLLAGFSWASLSESIARGPLITMGNQMVRILISIFNSLFFFALTLVFSHNGAVASLAAAVVWLVTFFALSLTTMAHTSNDVHIEKDSNQPMQKGFQFISQGVKRKDYLKIPTQRY